MRACQRIARTTGLFRKFPMNESHKYALKKAPSGYPAMNNPKPKWEA
jgi:hypothetical protein